jgi:hypothetical protein
MNSDATGQMFLLHRSNGDGRFAAVDSLKSDRQKNYVFRDRSLQSGITRYFITCRSANGDEHASSTVSVKRNGIAAAPYPNPFEKSLNIVLPSSSKLVVVVTDISGRRLKSYSFSMKDNIMQLSFEQLAAGMYFIRAVQDGNENVYKVWKK